MAKKKAAKADSYDDILGDIVTGGSVRRGQYWDFPQGESLVRPLPFKSEVDGKWHLFVEDRSHWIDNTRKTCLGTGNCPHCDDGDRPSIRYLANAIVREGKDTKRVIARMPKSVVDGNSMTDSEGMMDFVKGNPERGTKRIANLVHPTKGRFFKVERRGQKIKTRYSVSVMSKVEKVDANGAVDLFQVVESAKERAAEEDSE